MARARTGEKQWRVREKTWKGRVRGDDGKRGPWLDLCTDDDKIADKRLEQWVLTGEAPSQAGKETFARAAERILREQADRGVTAERRHRLRAFALPVIGHVEIAKLKAPHVHSVLVGMDAQRAAIAVRAAERGAAHVAAELGLVEATVERWVREQQSSESKRFALDTVHHMRVDISRVLGALVLEGAIDSNVATGVELPDDVEYDDRPFVVLNDDEVSRFFRRGFADELMMACLLSREFAGQRTSDLIGADYEDYDFVGWTALVRRPKTDDRGSTKYKKRRKRRVTLMYERVRLVIPEPVRAPLLAWRDKHRNAVTGELPTTGPLFPATRGKNAGGRKSSRGNSWAEALRDALWEEGIVRPLPGYETAVGEDRRKYCALQVDTDYSRRAVFHSFRRASVTALRKAGVPVNLAMLITGHSSLPTHMGYDATDEAIAIPVASLATGGGGRPPALPQPPPPPPAAEAMVATGAEPCRGPDGAPPADLGGVRPPVPPALAEVLTALLGVLRGEGAGQAFDPGRGSNEGFPGSIDPRIVQGFQGRARKDSNLRPSASEAVDPLLPARKDTDADPAGPPRVGPSEQGLTHVPGQSPPTPEPTLDELLRAAAHAAVEAGNWTLLRGLEPLIDAEAKRASASAPVSLEAVRAKREGK